MTYDKKYYEKNKLKFLEWQRQYRTKHKDKVKENRKKYESNLEVKQRINELKRKNRQKPNAQLKIKEYRQRDYVKQKSRERIAIKRAITNHSYDKQYYLNNKERISQRQKRHAQLPHVKARRNELTRIWRKNNPRSNRSFSLELQLAMNNARLRDKNTCQWQGCGKKYRDADIHVHHIFPRSEYPELELIEQYMICYCANHHALFHRYRGDPYHNMIYPSQEYLDTHQEELLLGGD